MPRQKKEKATRYHCTSAAAASAEDKLVRIIALFGGSRERNKAEAKR